MKPFSLLLALTFLPLSVFPAGCGGGGTADGDTETDEDAIIDGDMEDGDVADRDSAETDADTEADEDGGEIESDCSPHCWMSSSYRATESLDELVAWRATCEQADPGCPGHRCVPVTLSFSNSSAGTWAVQCESRPDWMDEMDPPYYENGSVSWLGPAYGMMSADTERLESKPTGWVELHSPLQFLEPQVSTPPAWDAKMIGDVLAHDLSAVPCEAITDYRSCVRAFIPPNIHCVPIFSFARRTSECPTLLWKTGQFAGMCTRAWEPHNSDYWCGYHDGLCDDMRGGPFRDTITGACLMLSAAPVTAGWERVATCDETSDEPWQDPEIDLDCDSVPLPPLPAHCSPGPVVFPDRWLERAVRTAAGKPEGILHAVDLAGITELAVSSVTNLSGIECIPSLCRFGVGESNLADLAPLAGLTRLKAVGLFQTAVVDIAPLAGLVHLKSLGLSRNPVADFSTLSRFTWLEELHLSRCGLSDLSPLQPLTRLRFLQVSDNPYTDLSPLAGMTELIYLAVGNEQGGITDVKPLAGLMKLQFLSLGGSVTDIAPLASLAQIKVIGMQGNRVADLTPLSGMSQLYRVAFDDNEVVDLAPLEGLVRLDVVSLRGNRIVDLGPLARNAELECPDQVEIEGNPLDCHAQTENIMRLRERGVYVGTDCRR